MKIIKKRVLIITLLIISLFLFQSLASERPSGGTAARGTNEDTPAQPLYSCSNPQQCREIDEVWQRIGMNVRKSEMIWDNSKSPEWRMFTAVYEPPAQTVSASTTVTVGGIQLDREESIGTASDQLTQKQCLINNFGWYAQSQNYNNLENIPAVTASTLRLETVTVSGLSREVNSVMAQSLRNVAQVIEQSGYKVHNWHSCRAEDDDPKDNLYDAPKCGSLHVACLAIDINPQENPHCSKVADNPDWWGRVPSAEERERCRRGEIVTDIPPVIVKAFEDNGFYWGGRYGQVRGKPTPDSMHFEYIGGGQCCRRTYGQLSYSPTPESTFNTNPRYTT